MIDFYLEDNASFNRLLEEYTKYGSLVIAYDFDDTVYDFHKKERTYHQVIELLQDLKSIGCYLICWTGNQDLTFVNNYLKENSIPCDGINDNPVFYDSNSRKIYANAYLDDRAGLKQVYRELKSIVELKK